MNNRIFSPTSLIRWLLACERTMDGGKLIILTSILLYTIVIIKTGKGKGTFFETWKLSTSPFLFFLQRRRTLRTLSVWKSATIYLYVKRNKDMFVEKTMRMLFVNLDRPSQFLLAISSLEYIFQREGFQNFIKKKKKKHYGTVVSKVDRLYTHCTCFNRKYEFLYNRNA